MATYSQAQREYWAKRPANAIKYMTVEFSHPDFGFIRLVANQFSDKQFNVDGTMQTFQAVSMEVPEVTNQSVDDTRAGAIIFGRIGVEVRKKLMQITPLRSMTNPITVKLRQYEDGANIYERRLYVARDGISISRDNVNVRLSVDNPTKLSNEQAFYNVETWIGLAEG